jgi:hypothetical protein
MAVRRQPSCNCGDVVRNRFSVSAVSAVTPRFPSTISFRGLRDTPGCRAASI